MPEPAAPDLLTALLREVSRSFYLTLWALPARVRRPIGLGYLLARATDTIADTDLVPVPERLTALAALQDRIQGRRAAPLDFSRLAEAQAAGASPGERRLLQRVEEAVAVLHGLESGDATRVREVLQTITGGQVLDLQRFGSGQRGEVRALGNGAELDDYTYRVAGCVGEFWTRICQRHLFAGDRVDLAGLLRDGVRFGQGLQLVNILRDLPRDLRAGRCYLPADELAAVGLAPTDLLDPQNEGRLWPVYEAWLGRADAHLAAGWAYTLALPRRQVRVRLACAWPILLGIQTLARLRGGGVLDPARRIKVRRSDVRATVWATVWRLPHGASWQGLAGWAQQRGAAAAKDARVRR